MAQSIKCPTLYFSSGHDLRVVRLRHVMGSVLSLEPTGDSLSPSLFRFAPSSVTHVCSLNLSLNTHTHTHMHKTRHLFSWAIGNA